MSEDEQWQELDALLKQALELPKGKRQAFVEGCPEATRARLGRLLALAEQTDELLVPGAGLEAYASTPEASQQPGPTFEPGQVLAERYRLDAAVGAGGMGSVFRGRDLILDRDIAIKVIDKPGADPGWRQRVLREARAAAALNHPNVVAIHDAAEESGVPFLVMEYVDGQTLQDAPPAGFDEIRSVALQVCAALEHVHRRGIVHRDLKPANLLVVEEDGQSVVKLTDLGIALAGGIDRMTEGHKTIGTPYYMAPEQASGGAIDPRTDLYAFGVMLYEWCAGRLPFAAESLAEVLAQHIHAEPAPPRDHVPDIPLRLDGIICRLLAKRPDDRFGSATDLRVALEGAFASDAPSPFPAGAAARIPRPRTRLIGRSREREAIRRLVLDDTARLITLTGPGGAGKTRLAIQAVEDLHAHFAGRTYFVPLASVGDADLVAAEIARAIGIRGAVSTEQAIRSELAALHERILLVLDNFEQVMDAVTLIGDLLTAAPTLTVLVTSREVLRLYAEHDVPVAPLELPHTDNLPPLDELERCAAVALFTERAQAADPKFRLTAENAKAVVALCSRLDGLPLALELAAARARLMSPKAMLARLHSSLNLLTTGARDLPDRQQTLRGALDWSFELLDPAEASLFCSLGAFVGGFTLEAAEAVGDTYGKLDIGVVDGIAALVDKSLIQRLEDGDDGDEPRFHMLGTIREYAADKLRETGERDARKAHAAYYLVIAEEGSGKLAGGEEARWVDTFTREHDNLRAALEWLTEHREMEWALRLALALFHFWERAEHLSEGRRRLNALLRLEESHKFKRLRGRALHSAGVLAFTQGDLAEGRRLQLESLDVHREIGDDRGMAVALIGLGINATERRDYPGAERYLTESLAAWNRVGDRPGYARSLSNLAFVVKMQNDHEKARSYYDEAAMIFEESGDRIGAAWAVNHQADVVAELGDHEGACALYEKAEASFKALDNHWGLATCRTDRGNVAARRGDTETAIGLYKDALRTLVQLGHKRGMARLFEFLAISVAQQGRAEAGLALAAAAQSLRQRIGTPASDTDAGALREHIARMKRELGTEASESVWREASELSLPDAIRAALEV